MNKSLQAPSGSQISKVSKPHTWRSISQTPPGSS